MRIYEGSFFLVEGMEGDPDLFYVEYLPNAGMPFDCELIESTSIKLSALFSFSMQTKK